MKSRSKKRQAWGQHFLADRRVLARILRIIDPRPEDLIIEIGAGKGVLTFPLAGSAGKVIAIEKDRDLVPRLRDRATGNLSIVEDDALRVDFRALVGAEDRPPGLVKVVGNLPYSISSPLMFKVLENKDLFRLCVFLVQKEVAERIAAPPGSKKYAPLSILVHNVFSARIRFSVHPGSFSPPPRVESALISLERRPAPLFPVTGEDRFLEFLQKAFKQRRKILLNNLRRFPLDAVQAAYEKLGLKHNVRSEELSLEQFVKLFDFLGPFVFRRRSA